MAEKVLIAFGRRSMKILIMSHGGGWTSFECTACGGGKVLITFGGGSGISFDYVWRWWRFMRGWTTVVV